MLNAMMMWLLIFVPITIGLEYLKPDAHTWIFLSACLSVIPLAGILGHATEQIAARLGEGVGGLLNATFGNAAELIIAIAALQKGLYDVVKASLTGSIIGNVLLVFGLSAFAGGLKHKKQNFNQTAASAQAVLLTLAAVGLIVPAAFHHLQQYGPHEREDRLGLDISIVLLLTYGAHLAFSLYTHRSLFAGNQVAEVHKTGLPSLTRSVAMLAVATVAIAWISEILVGSVQEAAKAFGMTEIFVGVIIVAIIGNAAEHSTAILAAMKNRMELSFGVAVGSSIQIALLVAPLLVILSRFIGPRPMDLAFTPAEVLAIFLSVLITGQVAQDGETNWLEGAQLLAVYIILGIVFYFLPDVPSTVRP